ncbi:thiol-disulfide oxidoreductase DCC family protein [Alkalihalobacterium chitinilyticum]|uniref:Thiol-disulfide oxidoreductase DCC family protein n=1 Tax=Alkalihalobacterium chitinilyticum TaxID=2980103 RepID=A0ABT5VDC1_9BACI|nr:thiol-disulfide oxidoreductase DCC family protein [Alkalihalobacterium chitinilyticum]MDE5413452.1 thiol-disulfide oxidoreductase DCC family protein [Alkalihalobacterium chitinilyticum]
MGGIVLFDGVCNFCHHSVQFILKRDKRGYFKFASLQSDIGKRLLDQYHLPHDMSTFVLIDNDKPFIKSSAALRVCKYLDGFWRFMVIFRFIPTPIRNIVYNFIAQNRYRWFGQRESCMLPTPEQRKRFLD